MFVFDLISAAIVMVLAVFVMVDSRYLPPSETAGIGPGVWPGFLGAILLLLGVILLLETVWKMRSFRRREEAGERVERPAAPFIFNAPGMRGLYGLLGILAIFVAIMYYAGFLWGTVFMVPASMRLLGEKRAWMVAIMTVCIPVAVYVIFVKLLGINLPEV